MVEILNAAKHRKLISGWTRTRISSPSKEASWTPKNLQDSFIYIEISLLGLYNRPFRFYVQRTLRSINIWPPQRERHPIHCKIALQSYGLGSIFARLVEKETSAKGVGESRQEQRGSADQAPLGSADLTWSRGVLSSSSDMLFVSPNSTTMRFKFMMYLE